VGILITQKTFKIPVEIYFFRERIRL
jgi:hypothetical protein